MAYLKALACYVPEARLSNDDLVRLNPSWTSSRILANTGIRTRAVAASDQTAADLGYLAAERLMEEAGIARECVDAVLLCIQTPDYLSPASACILHERLALPASCAAFDFNVGCSGFVYGLWLARSLVLSESARNVLLIVADTPAKYCDPHDPATVTLFGDGAAAALVTSDRQGAIASLGPAIVGTDGRGAEHLIIRAGGARHRVGLRRGNSQEPAGQECISMNGAAIFSFSLARVQSGIQQLLERVGRSWPDIDLFLLHQANGFMLEQLRLKMNLPKEKMPVNIEEVGNTASASIPILMDRCRQGGVFRAGHRCVLAGFGVGLSWAMMYLEWLGAAGEA